MVTTQKTHQITALIEMSALITSSLETREITKRAIEAAVNLLQAEAGSLILMDHETRELVFDVALGEKGDALKEIRLPRGCGIAGWVAEQGVPQIIADVRADDRFYRELDDACGFVTREMLCVPVRFKDRMFGVLETINKTSGSFTTEDMKVLQALANQVAVALENARLYQENCQQYEEMLATEKGHQKEKEKLLKDLHDGIGGLITNINLLSELALKTGMLDDIKRLLGTIAELSREGMWEIRTLMNALEDKEASWHDLAAELRRHGYSTIEPHNILFTIDTAVAEAAGPPGVLLYISLLRIYKEALVNIIKHAAATNVSVSFSVSDESILLSVRDDGTPNLVQHKAGRGIANMKARARELGGTAEFTVGPGTEVCVRLPLTSHGRCIPSVPAK